MLSLTFVIMHARDITHNHKKQKAQNWTQFSKNEDNLSNCLLSVNEQQMNRSVFPQKLLMSGRTISYFSAVLALWCWQNLLSVLNVSNELLVS